LHGQVVKDLPISYLNLAFWAILPYFLTSCMSKRKVIIVGGGAAGLLAAGCAASQGADVVIFEKKERPGRKLLISGKGRCNLTNSAPLKDFLPRFCNNGKFLRQAFNQFFSEDLVLLLMELGVPTDTERGGRGSGTVTITYNAVKAANQLLKVKL